MSKHFDCIIIGSGQAGTPLSTAFANAGKKTALIERTHVGGCCVNEGCTPTKTMIASGRVAYLARRGQDYGVHSPVGGTTAKTLEGNDQNEVKVDMVKVRERKRNIVTDSRTRNENRVKGAGVELFMGEGSFVDTKTIKVKMGDGTEETITGDVICINTGERPASPKLQGIESVPKELILDSTSIMELGQVPSHLFVVGGGYIGLEFGQLFRRLGAEVTIIQRGKRLMAREDPDITSALLEIVREDGITVHLEAAAHSVSYNSDQIHLVVKTPQGDVNLSGSHILFAAGRVPNVEPLNLAAAGVKVDEKRGYILCNEKLETNVPGIYALGDVKGPPAFTHISYDDFRIIQTNLITNASNTSAKAATTTERLVPYVAYTDPQLGHVGLHVDEARRKFPNATIKTAKMPMNYVARALETDESRGLMKAVVNADTGMILGFSCLGLEGGEVMAIVQTAIMGNLRWEVLRDAVWAHPSLAESLNNLWGFLE